MCVERWKEQDDWNENACFIPTSGRPGVRRVCSIACAFVPCELALLAPSPNESGHGREECGSQSATFVDFKPRTSVSNGLCGELHLNVRQGHASSAFLLFASPRGCSAPRKAPGGRLNNSNHHEAHHARSRSAQLRHVLRSTGRAAACLARAGRGCQATECSHYWYVVQGRLTGHRILIICRRWRRRRIHRLPLGQIRSRRSRPDRCHRLRT